MKTRIRAAAVMVPAALLILLVLPPVFLTLTVAAVCAFSAYELFSAVNDTCPKKPAGRAAVYAIIIAVMMPFTAYISGIYNVIPLSGELTIAFILICLLIADYLLTYKTDKTIRLRQLLVMPAAALLMPFMLSSLVALRVQPEYGRLLVMLPVVVTILTDSGAYFTGRAIGKYKPFPAISPNKTVEGFIGGILAGMAGLFIYGLIMGTVITDADVKYPMLLLYGFLGALATEAGDLAFSFVKRKCEIKDFGDTIPGHGGFLDRFDSMFFSAPVMYLLVLALPVTPGI